MKISKKTGQTTLMRGCLVVMTVLAVITVWACGGDEEEGGGGPPMGGGGSGGPVVTVETVAPERDEFVVTGNYAGEVRSEEMTEVSSEVAGRLLEVQANIGDAVDEGQLLGRVDDRNLRQSVRELAASVSVSQATKAEAEVNLSNLESDLRRKQPLRDRDMVSEREIEELENSIANAEQQLAVAEAQIEQAQARLASARDDLDNTQIRAPFDGVIGNRYVERGSHVQPGQAIFSVVDDDMLYVAVQVPERKAAMVHAQTPVQIRVGALNSTALVGEIHRVAPMMDSATRSLRVDVAVVDEEGWTLRPGMYARLSMEHGRMDDALVLTNQAIQHDLDGTPYVWRVVDGEAEKVEVSVEMRGRESSALGDAIKEGDRIVLRGHETLEEGSKVRDVHRSDGPDISEDLEGPVE